MDEKPYRSQNGNSNFPKSSNSRPASFYDNFGDGHADQFDTVNNINCQSDDVSSNKFPNNEVDEETDADRSPTQEFLLKTTVPQNLAAANLAGRHTPTRNSLRHSRMIVMTRTGTSPRSYHPPVIRHLRLATLLVALQTLLGASICCLAAWLLVWTPSLRKRDNPYWSGLPLLASGTLGLLLLCCCQMDRPRTLKRYFVNGVKLFSGVLSLTATVASFIASAFALVHILMLSAMTCESKIQLNETCLCQMGPNATYPWKTYHYADLKCPDVDYLFTNLLIISCVLNTLASIVSLSYVYLHCSTKYRHLYTKVRRKGTKHPRAV